MADWACQHSLDVARAAATALQYLMGRSIEFHRRVARGPWTTGNAADV